MTYHPQGRSFPKLSSIPPYLDSETTLLQHHLIIDSKPDSVAARSALSILHSKEKILGLLLGAFFLLSCKGPFYAARVHRDIEASFDQPCKSLWAKGRIRGPRRLHKGNQFL